MPVKPPSAAIETEAAEDSAAQDESANFTRLDEIERAKHQVKMAIHRALAWLVPASVIIAFVLFWIGIVIYTIHIFTPLHWLSDDQLHELRTILFSGVIGAVVSQGIKYYLD